MVIDPIYIPHLTAAVPILRCGLWMVALLQPKKVAYFLSILLMYAAVMGTIFPFFFRTSKGLSSFLPCPTLSNYDLYPDYKGHQLVSQTRDHFVCHPVMLMLGKRKAYSNYLSRACPFAECARSHALLVSLKSKVVPATRFLKQRSVVRRLTRSVQTSSGPTGPRTILRMLAPLTVKCSCLFIMCLPSAELRW